MINQLILTLLVFVGISLLLVFNEIIYRRLGLSGEVTRKFAHMTATLTTISFPYLFDHHIYVLFLSLCFFTLLFISRNALYLKSIHGIDRKSVGSYLLPVSIYLTFLFAWIFQSRILFILPMLVLAICDPLAGILGINITTHNHQIILFSKRLKKTWLGSLSFFISCFLISTFALYIYHEAFDLYTFLLAVLIAIAGTFAEMFSLKGTDNLFVPLSVVIILHFFG